MDYRITVEPYEDKKSKPGETIAAAKAFPVGVEEITFGRDPANGLVFPPGSQRIVSRKHGRIFRQSSGDYAIEPFGDRYIEIDGYPADRGQPLRDGAIVRIGDGDGPAFKVRLEELESRVAPGDPEVTGKRRGREPLGKVLARNRQVQIAGLALILVVAAAVAWLYTRVPSLDAELAALRAAAAERAAGEFASTDTLMQSAYAVVIRDRDGNDRVVGTAWPTPAAPGVLITNAHIANAFNGLMGGTLLVRPPSGVEGVDHVVTGVRLHPGYLAFKDFVAHEGNGSLGFGDMTGELVMPSAYDVGVLEVEDGDQLPAGLPIAPDAGPGGLRPGMALAFAGYPIEGTGSQLSMQIAPNPQLQFGAVTSLSDFFLFGTDADAALLVQNSLPAAGGASGSAVVNGDGEVVAVLSGGNVVATEEGRTPSAVLLNYAQRADLVAAAIEPSLFDLEAARAEWRVTLDRFNAHENAMVEATRAALGETTGMPVGEAELIVPASLRGAGAERAGTTQFRVHDVEVRAGHTYSFLVYGERDGSLTLTLFRDGKGFDGAGGSRWFANLVFTADRDETIQVRVLGAASNPVDYKFYVFGAEQTPATAPLPADSTLWSGGSASPT